MIGPEVGDVTHSLPSRNPRETPGLHTGSMVRSLLSLPVSVVRFSIGSVIMLTQVMMLDRMLDELHR